MQRIYWRNTQNRLLRPFYSRNFSEKKAFNAEFWKVKYRIAINVTFGNISEIKPYKSIVSSKLIDRENWNSYLNTMRRNLINNPITVLNDQAKVTQLGQ